MLNFILNGRKKPLNDQRVNSYLMAEWTGLEPATPGVTGRYANTNNSISYSTFFIR